MVFLFFCVLLLVLNPYTIFGPIAYYLGLPFAGVAVIHGKTVLHKRIIFLFLTLAAISFVGVFSSAVHDIPQFEHLKVSVSIAVYYAIGAGIFISFKKIDIDDVLLVSLYAAVANSVVILLQVQFPELRDFIESLFAPSGNRDWSDGFRYRGIASGGGASLSVLSAFSTYICLYLYDVKKISVLETAVVLAILIVPIFFIGRTGVLLAFLVFAFWVLSQGWRNTRNIAATIAGISFAIFFGFDHLKEFLIQEYGEGFYRYAVGFFLEGVEGIEDEGTVDVILEFFATVPKEFPEILIGYGFYGGSDFSPWTDSGYARMFLSVGFMFGFVFYACALYIFMISGQGKQKLFLPLIAMLAVAEVKEVILFAGYSSRLLFILLGFWTAQKLQTHRLAIREIATSPVPQ